MEFTKTVSEALVEVALNNLEDRTQRAEEALNSFFLLSDISARGKHSTRGHSHGLSPDMLDRLKQSLHR